MNDPTFVEAARVFAEDLAASSRQDPESHLKPATLDDSDKESQRVKTDDSKRRV